MVFHPEKIMKTALKKKKNTTGAAKTNQKRTKKPLVKPRAEDVLSDSGEQNLGTYPSTIELAMVAANLKSTQSGRATSDSLLAKQALNLFMASGKVIEEQKQRDEANQLWEEQEKAWLSSIAIPPKDKFPVKLDVMLRQTGIKKVPDRTKAFRDFIRHTPKRDAFGNTVGKYTDKEVDRIFGKHAEIKTQDQFVGVLKAFTNFNKQSRRSILSSESIKKRWAKNAV